MTMTTSQHGLDPEELARRHFDAMTSGSLDELRAVVHPEATNREATIEPPACRGRGPDAWHATAAWLRTMSSDCRWEIHEVVASDNLVAVHATMTGHQTGDHTRYDSDGRIVQVMGASGRTFRVTQSHWLRVADGLVIEHWANRDDLGMAMQLGWFTALVDQS
jgi:ketosteroid isomerase-like protein